MSLFGWCADGRHLLCRHTVKRSEGEPLVCSCQCHQAADPTAHQPNHLNNL